MQLPCVIDIEASGLGRGSYAIEIGFITAAGKSYCTLVKPAQGWTHWSGEAEKLHGISRSLLDEKGRNVASTASWLNELLGGTIVYSDGWVNDMCWLGKLFDEADVEPQFKIESILMLMDEYEKERWTPTHNAVIKECCFKRHRASLDAKNIQRTFQRIKQLSYDKMQNGLPNQGSSLFKTNNE